MKEITWDDQWIAYGGADTIKHKKAWADNQLIWRYHGMERRLRFWRREVRPPQS